MSGIQVFRQQQVKEDYEEWKRNSVYLYDMIAIQKLPMSPLCIDWDTTSPRSLLCGTEDNGTNSNSILRISVSESSSLYQTQIDENIPCEGSIERLRIMPQNRTTAAVKSVDGKVLVMDSKTGKAQSLMGLSSGGGGLAWSTMDEGLLASGSGDRRICIWKLEFNQPQVVFSNHPCEITDLSWSSKDIFGVSGNDGSVTVYDLRQSSYSSLIKCHDHPCTFLRYNPYMCDIFITGSTNGQVALWDSRFSSYPLHILEGHTASICCGDWSPHCQSKVVTGGDDMKVIVWDLLKIGQEQSAEEEEDGSAELLFTHQGHTERVNDVRWNPQDAGVIASVGNDHTVQVWKISDSLFKDDILDDSLLE